MNDKVFIDTNILVYTYSNSEPQKQAIARKLIADNNSFISTQVLHELTNTVIRKFKYSYEDALNAINECCQNNNLYTNQFSTILEACKIAERYNYTFYDGLIVAAAIEAGCTILYSEDMTHNHLVFKSVTIINPFKI